MTAPIVVTFIVVGIVAGIAIGMGIAPVFGFRHMEGSSAIFAVLFGGPLGGILGALCGGALSRKFADDPQKQRLILTGAWVIIGVVMLQSAVSSLIGSSDYLSSGSASSIAYEIRLPAGAAAPSNKNDVLVELRSDKETQKASMYDGLWLRKDGERPVIRGVIEFHRVTHDRTIALRLGEGPTHLFKLRIPARPRSSPAFYEDWFPVDHIHDSKPGVPPRAPRPDEMSEIRHFVTIRD